MKRFFLSVRFALKGIQRLFKSETNFRIQLLFAVFAILFGFYLSISRMDWILVFLLCAFVLSAEGFNSAIEKLCDLYSIEQNPKIEWIKDVAAGAVLICSIAALLIAILIFVPYFID